MQDTIGFAVGELPTGPTHGNRIGSSQSGESSGVPTHATSFELANLKKWVEPKGAKRSHVHKDERNARKEKMITREDLKVAERGDVLRAMGK